MNLWTIQNDKLKLSLHRGQARAWKSDARFVFVIAGTQGGKTSFLPWWLYREIYDPVIGKGSGDYLAVTSTYKLFKRKFLGEMRTVFEYTMGLGRWWAGDQIIELKDPETGKFWAKNADDLMWGRIMLGAASSPGGLESSTVKAAILDECGQDEFTLESWEAIQARLSLAMGRICGATTPYNLGWLKTEIWDAWENGDDDIDVINFSSVMNPAFPKEEYDRQQTKMQDWRFLMRYGGQFSRPAGLIYNCFKSDMLVDPFDIPLDWEKVVGIDFGGANTATLWLAEDPDTEVWYIYHETLEGGITSREHAEKASEFAGESEDVRAIGGAKSEQQNRNDWIDGGFFVSEPKISSVESGIDKVTELIKSDRFHVFRTCRGLRDELGGYRRKLDNEGNPSDDILNKRKYHRLDALRYAAVGIALGQPIVFA